MKNTNHISEDLKPTLSKPVTKQAQTLEKDFKPVMTKMGALNNRPLVETDGLLDEAEQSLKKKIFSLGKMESLVFSDPKLSAVYEDMALNGEEKFGYHYNETIMNMIFNDYVLNSSKYLQKYKMAIPHEKKRRDKSGINKLKRDGENKMGTKIIEPKIEKTESSVEETTGAGSAGAFAPALGFQKKITEETDEHKTKVYFLVNEKDPSNTDIYAYFPEEVHNGVYKTAYSHIGQHSSIHPSYAQESRQATPEEYQDLKTELEGLGYNLEILNGLNETTSASSAGGAAGYVGYAGPAAWSEKGDLLGHKGEPIRKPIYKGGTIVEESVNYLIDPKGFSKYIDILNEDVASSANAVGMPAPRPTPSPAQASNVKPYTNPAVNNKIIDKTSAFTSDTVKQWGKPDTELELNTVDHGTMNEEGGEWEAKQDLVQLQRDAADAQNQAHQYIPKAMEAVKNTKNVDEFLSKIWEFFNANDITDSDLTEAITSMTYRQVRNNFIKEDMQTMINTKEDSMSNKIEPIGSQSSGMEMGMNSQMNEIENTEIAKITIDGTPYFLKKAGDSTHFYMTNNLEGLSDAGGMSVGHIAQHNGEPYYPAVRDWLKGGESPDGKSFGSNKYQDRMNEATNLLAEVEKEINAFSTHQNTLKKMTEDKKPSSLVLKDRLGDENKVNFKKDLQHSGTKEIIDVEKDLQWKDQQTEIGKDAQKLGLDIEKSELKTTGGESFKNVGDSTNEKGDEIPKRNLTTDEQEEVDLYRLGLGDVVFDNAPGQKYEDRMKKDMGDENYQARQDKLAFRAKAPMYNKDAQPVEKGIEKNQFDKEKSGWNERTGIKETMVTGRYYDDGGKSHMIDFLLGEAKIVAEANTNWKSVNLSGLGNAYANKLDGDSSKLAINESVANAIENSKFYVDENMAIFAVSGKISLIESAEVKKVVIDENINNIKHLIGYESSKFTDTTGIKNNRGF